MHVSIVLRAHLPNQVQLYENDADNDAEEHMNSFCKYALQDVQAAISLLLIRCN